MPDLFPNLSVQMFEEGPFSSLGCSEVCSNSWTFESLFEERLLLVAGNLLCSGKPLVPV